MKRLTLDLREECRRVGGFPRIRVVEGADLGLERPERRQPHGYA
jgi:hypothetical protein